MNPKIEPTQNLNSETNSQEKASEQDIESERDRFERSGE